MLDRGHRSEPPAIAERHGALRCDMLEEFEWRAFQERCWLQYTILGWTNLLACIVSHYFVVVLQLQEYWPYVALWAGQVALALLGITLAGASWKNDHLPLVGHINRISTFFVLMCWNVSALNVLLGLPVFVLLPALATLSSFALLMLSTIASRRLILGALVMLVTGSLMALFPGVGFLIYGAGWLLVLQTLGIIFFGKRRRWLAKKASGECFAEAYPLAIQTALHSTRERRL
jgi:hypothetical protein